jgi:hypothetical protein
MAATLDRQELYRLARLGAEARLRTLDDERRQILRNFPGLRAGGGSEQAPSSAAASPAPASRRRRQMSAAERKAVSARMKKYWAERRKAKG